MKSICWFKEDVPIQLPNQRSGFQCERCGKVERCARLACHGLLSAKNKRRLEEDRVQLLLVSAAKKSVYTFASPVKRNSIVARDLMNYYGGGDMELGHKALEGALSTVEGRCKVASDCLHLRRAGKHNVRISISRETDRFTYLLNGALQTMHAIAMRVDRKSELRAIYLNCYFVRTALSDPTRAALHNRTFPLFDASIFSLPMGLFLFSLAEGIIDLLVATNFTPYSKLVMPYSRWVDNVAVYLARGKNLTAIQDLVMFASALLGMSEDVLLSPALADNCIIAIPYFSFFRSKEIWLDVFHQLVTNRNFYGLSNEQVQRIEKELLEVGEPGPGTGGGVSQVFFGFS